MEKKCLNCGWKLKLSSTPHKWVSEILLAPCGMVRRCNRCHAEEKYEEHEYPDWEVLPDSCQKTRSCTKCGKTSILPAHLYDKYRDLNEMYHIKICSQCGYEDETPQFHTWGETEREESFERSSLTKRCINCGKVDITYHQWRDY